jgi:2-keto-3-deoxy-L-rhamnonate aldolase RhmA
MPGLRRRIAGGEPVIGTFVKTPAYQVVEVLALAGLDFLVADAEHAPIELGTLDAMALAARSGGIPLGVRPRISSAEHIAPAMDLGCSLVLAPHVRSARDAAEVVGAVRFSEHRRGFSPSTRAAGYGTMDPAEYRRLTDDDTVVIAQIEDVEALDNLDEICAVPGIDVLFVGPADLGASMRCSAGDPALERAIRDVAAASLRAGKAAGLFVRNAKTVQSWRGAGISVFVCGSDQSLLLAGARSLSASWNAGNSKHQETQSEGE